MKLAIVLLTLVFASQLNAQNNNPPDSNQQKYLAELKIAGKQFTQNFYPNYAAIHSLPEKPFVSKIDSVRDQFISILNKYKKNLSESYARNQATEIKYYFDKLLVDYLLNHDTYVGKTSSTPSGIPARLKTNLVDFNNPELLANSDFTDYVKAFLYLQTTYELKKPVYKNQDNQHLTAVWNLIPQFFSNAQCRDFWRCDYLYNHIDNNGIKNIKPIYNNFRSACKDTNYLNKVSALYTEDSTGRQGHLVKTYKTIGPFNLDMHIFLPDSFLNGKKRPVIVCFHGGSWTEGKLDWFFSSCENYAKKGWVACAVEYRTYSRNGTLPFAAVMDARSAIRWLRKNADLYNIDTNRIVATGNSAGGHLVLTSALADKWNEKTDDLRFSSAPNVLLVNSGVYDLTDQGTAWIRKDLKDKTLAKEISPAYLVRKGTPPTLIIHGTNDGNVPYSSAKMFADEMTRAGNNLEFQTLNGAGHFIWYDPKYSSEVSKLRNSFLTKLGY
jgi:acetyl esterase/lipase